MTDQPAPAAGLTPEDARDFARQIEDAICGYGGAMDERRWADVQAIIQRIASAAAERERAANDHGLGTERCQCPGCKERVPACWISWICRACASEECTDDCDGVQEEF